MTLMPYSLRLGRENSNEFYGATARLAEETAKHIREQNSRLLAFYTKEKAGTESAEASEYPQELYELLALSVLWREYGREAQRIRRSVKLARRGLFRLLRAGILPRRLLDPLCAQTAESMLPTPSKAAAASSTSKPGKLKKPDALPPVPTPVSWRRFTEWLRASGEYDQEAVHAARFLQNGLQALGKEQIQAFSAMEHAFRELEELGDWFSARSLEALGEFTEGVEAFRTRELHASQHREDRLLRTKPRSVYHLQMTGAELLSRAYRPDYNASACKLTLVPRCLARRGNDCRAKADEYGFVCSGCDPQCPIKQLTALGKKEGFRVRIMPHQSDIFKPSALADLRAERTGVIGVACAATLIDGGLKLKAAGIPSQCVLLDSCGCREHWHPSGIPTDLNLHRFCEVLATNPDP
ncbi:DUF116 domain-containing protein [Gorillibacterium timonense]|uniref:DUF116 domain-containing protein n=1 Tax=Gorillibacterium timonense TaxID=1689269 RepID=UPI00071E0B54|nr:DUF116 domain-containing protein [Gorillibacterium timonense]